MAKIYRLSKTGLRIFYKIRHRRGHGIHSPFVFNLITNVIEEKNPYYGYEDIKRHIINHLPERKSVTKSNLLAFRFVNYFNAKNILEIGGGNGLNTLCLTAPNRNICCHTVEIDPKKQVLAQRLFEHWNRSIFFHTNELPTLKDKQDCIYINLQYYTQYTESFIDNIFELAHEKTFIFIKGIRINKANKSLWNKMKGDERITVSLDLFKQGILFFDPKLYKRNYIISF